MSKLDQWKCDACGATVDAERDAILGNTPLDHSEWSHLWCRLPTKFNTTLTFDACSMVCLLAVLRRGIDAVATLLPPEPEHPTTTVGPYR